MILYITGILLPFFCCAMESLEPQKKLPDKDQNIQKIKMLYTILNAYDIEDEEEQTKLKKALNNLQPNHPSVALWLKTGNKVEKKKKKALLQEIKKEQKRATQNSGKDKNQFDESIAICKQVYN